METSEQGSKSQVRPGTLTLLWSLKFGASLVFGVWNLVLPPCAFAQGNLAPPGPPGLTMKSLDQIEARTPISSAPFTISQPGSYYLTNDVTVNGGDAITINASSVALDLNGFTISSTASSANGTAILIGNNLSNIEIRNGFIQSGVVPGPPYSGSGFANGVDLVSITPGDVRISQLTVNGVLNDGIVVGGGNASVIESCTVQTAGGRGLWASSVRGCVANYCGMRGIIADEVSDSHAHTTLSGSTALFATYSAQNCFGFNQSDGYGIDASVAQNCYAQSTTGIAMGTWASINCYAVTGNNKALDVNAVSNCYALNTSATIATISGGNAVRGSFAQNSATGPAIVADDVSDCSAISSGGTGINVINANTVLNCSAVATTTAGAVGIRAQVIQNSFANVTGDSSEAIHASKSAINCFGLVNAGNGTGIFASNLSNCYGVAATGNALKGTNANSSFGQNASMTAAAIDTIGNVTFCTAENDSGGLAIKTCLAIGDAAIGGAVTASCSKQLGTP